MIHESVCVDELYFKDEFGITFSCKFDEECFYIGDGGYEGLIETNEQLEELIDFLTKYKGKLKE